MMIEWQTSPGHEVGFSLKSVYLLTIAHKSHKYRIDVTLSESFKATNV